MERDEGEAAVACAETAVLRGIDDTAGAAPPEFRRSAEAAFRGEDDIVEPPAAPATLAEMREALDRLTRENLELRGRLAIEAAAQASAAARLDAAYLRIFELNEESLAAQRLAEAVEREFDNFRAAYARIVENASGNEFALRRVLEDAQRNAGQRPVRAPSPSLVRLLGQARLGPGLGTPLPNGSGKLPTADPGAA